MSGPALLRSQGLSPVTAPEVLAALLDGPAAQEKVRALPSVVLHRLVCQVGPADSMELLEMAEPEQVREVLDLDIWQGTELDHDLLLDWTYLLSSLPDQAAFSHLRAMDTELKGALLLKYVRIYLMAEETAPDEPEGLLFKSPDGWFALEVLAHSEARAQQVVAVVDALYRDDADNARRLLQNLMWELPSELEMWSLRWRDARLQDLGFADPQEALALYNYLDPASVDVGEQTGDVLLKTDPEPSGELALMELTDPQASFWNQALASISDPSEQQRLATAMLNLSNRCLTADQVNPGDQDLARQSLEALNWRLSLGLEHLTGRQQDRSPAALAGVALLRIARLGHSLALEARQDLLPALRGGLLGREPGALDLLHSPLAHGLAALLLPRPLFWDAAAMIQRPFHTLAELDQARQWVREALAVVRLMQTLGLSDPLPAEVTFADLLRTAVINLLLKRQGPLDGAALSCFISQYIDQGRLDPAVLEQAMSLAQPAEEDRPVVEAMISVLEETLAPLHPGQLDLRFIDGLHLDVHRP